jgi:acyl-CoA synthetase (NDP forming)
MDSGPIAFLSQSGGHAENIPSYSGPRGLRFSKVVSYGNGLDLAANELLEYFANDDETEIIAAYIEGIKDGRNFFATLAKAAAKKPIVIYKGGKTDAGKRAAAGHTASMTSSVAVFDALCRQLNTIQVDSFDELIDVLVALRFSKPYPKGYGFALIGAGGGPSVLAGDVMEKAGLTLPAFSDDVQSALKESLPIPGSIFCNPLDTPNLGTPEAIASAMDVIGKIPDIHVLVYHMGFHPVTAWGYERFSASDFLVPVIEILTKVRRTTGKPIVLAIQPGLDEIGFREFFAVQNAFVKAGFPVFHSLHQAATAMARVIKWNRNRIG